MRETTWTITITLEDEGPTNASGTFTGAFTHMGGSYYTMQAYIDLSDDGPVVFAGGGSLIGDTLYMTMSGSQWHTDGRGNRDTEVFRLEMDKDTLNGKFYTVGWDFNVNSMEYGDHFSAGTLTLTGNPINIDPNAKKAALSGSNTLLLHEKD